MLDAFHRTRLDTVPFATTSEPNPLPSRRHKAIPSLASDCAHNRINVYSRADLSTHLKSIDQQRASANILANEIELIKIFTNKIAIKSVTD